MTKPKPKSKLKSKPKSTFNYTKTKLSAEDIVVIKKALLSYRPVELISEAMSLAEKLTASDDFFIILYTRKKRIRVRGEKTQEKTQEKTVVSNLTLF